MKIPNLLRTPTFQLALLYIVLFAFSVLLIFGFIYWSTVGYMARQTDATIQAELVGLAEQYSRQGLTGLVSVINERVARDRTGESVYLFAGHNYQRIAGNLERWPVGKTINNGWITFTLGKSARPEFQRPFRARIIAVEGGPYLLVGRNIDDLVHEQKLIFRALAWGIPITLGLALAGSLMMSRVTSRRIDVISQTSREIMKGDLARRIPTRGSGDVFDQLAGNLNDMLEQIERLMEGVRHVTDNIAHDLRTPLTRLRNQLEAVQRVVAERQLSIPEVEQAIDQADQLLKTFNALLRIARIEAGGHATRFEAVDLVAVVQDAVELYEVLAQEKAQQISLQAPDSAMLSGDRDLLFQAIANLLDNGIKYAPEGGTITIRITVCQGEISLAVADTGEGIPEALLEKVTERFYRVAKSRHLPGNGLGLSLVTAVASHHKGRMALENCSPGLRVTLYFPLLDMTENV